MPKPAANSPRVIKKAALAHFQDGKVMMVRDDKNETGFILPGGKIEDGESDQQCIVRECREELSVKVDRGSIKFSHKFLGPAHGKADALLDIRLYSATFIGEPKPAAEIVEIDYFDSQTDPARVSEIGQTQIFPWLKESGYIN